MEICPALPHKKKKEKKTRNEGASNLQSRSQSELYAQVFPPERAALAAERRKVGEMVFTD